MVLKIDHVGVVVNSKSLGKWLAILAPKGRALILFVHFPIGFLIIPHEAPFESIILFWLCLGRRVHPALDVLSVSTKARGKGESYFIVTFSLSSTKAVQQN